MRVLLLSMFVNAKRLDDAMKILQDINTSDPDAPLTPTKLLRLAMLLYTEGRVDGELCVLVWCRTPLLFLVSKCLRWQIINDSKSFSCFNRRTLASRHWYIVYHIRISN